MCALIKDTLNGFIFLFTLYITYSYIISSIEIKKICNILFIYSILDCYDSKIDVIIHHMIVLLMISMIKIYNINEHDCFQLGYHLLKVEISTVFLKAMDIFKYIKRKNNNKIIESLDKIVSLLFLLSFIYLRMIDYPYNYLFNKNLWYIIKKNNIEFLSNIIAFTFTSLNIYWLYCMYRKVIKSKR